VKLSEAFDHFSRLYAFAEVKRGAATVLVAGGVISTATAFTRGGQIPLRTLAATPAALAEGRVWLLVTSAVLADRPAAASIIGFLVVGLAATWLCGPRVTWVAAASGHVLSALIVYVAVGLFRFAEPAAFEHVLRLPDYGTSAVIAAWIGAIAYGLWLRGGRAGAVALVVASALLGWYFKGTLTVLDTEHAVALAFGVGSMRLAQAEPRLHPRLAVRKRLRAEEMVGVVPADRLRLRRDTLQRVHEALR
jgi:hypothetical protein